MGDMFNGCESLIILDLRSFNTSKVKIIDKLFFGCRSLDQIIINRRKWNLSYIYNNYTLFDTRNDDGMKVFHYV